MQHTQYNFIIAITVTALLLGGDAAIAGRIVQPSKPDPILDAGDTHPCLAGPDLVPGMNVTGRPVAPADVGGTPVPVPDQVLVPLAGAPRDRGRRAPPGTGNGPYAVLDGRRLAPLLNPDPCPR